jgi:cytochrome bd-type quinol oxidase subunit 2
MSTQASSTSGNTGPLGNPRGVLFVILLTIVTLGIYSIYWAYKTHEEMKQHTGDGLGGVLGLVIWILLTAVSAFVIPSEVGRMYVKSGRPQPISGWTGLWLFPFGVFLIPAIVWWVKVQGSLNRYWVSAAATSPDAPANEPAFQ